MPTPPALVAAVEREAATAADEISAAIRPLLAADAPLAAQSALSTDSGVIDEPEVAAALGKLHASIAAAGQRRCDHYRERTIDGGAYWSWLVARYCKHFGKATASAPLPYLARGIQLEASIAGISPASSAAVAARLSAALEGTPWHAADAGDARCRRAARGIRRRVSQRARHARGAVDRTCPLHGPGSPTGPAPREPPGDRVVHGSGPVHRPPERELFVRDIALAPDLLSQPVGHPLSDRSPHAHGDALPHRIPNRNPQRHPLPERPARVQLHGGSASGQLRAGEHADGQPAARRHAAASATRPPGGAHGRSATT